MAVISSGIQHILSRQKRDIDQILLYMEKSVSEFIWAANKETLTLIIFEPRLVLALFFILSWLQSISLLPHCIVILDFYLKKTRIVVRIKYYTIESVFKTWRKD